MKTLAAILSFCFVVSFFGCQENLVNQPETTFDTSPKKPAPVVNDVHNFYSETKGKLKICCDALDPLSGDCKIIGHVTYIHHIIHYSAGVATIEFNLAMDAELCTRLMSPVKYSIYGCSCDTINVSDPGSQIIEKNYEITNRPFLRLGVRYKLATAGIEIDKMVLHQID